MTLPYTFGGDQAKELQFRHGWDDLAAGNSNQSVNYVTRKAQGIDGSAG